MHHRNNVLLNYHFEPSKCLNKQALTVHSRYCATPEFTFFFFFWIGKKKLYLKTLQYAGKAHISLEVQKEEVQK